MRRKVAEAKEIQRPFIEEVFQSCRRSIVATVAPKYLNGS